jgi:hypothetical protein
VGSEEEATTLLDAYIERERERAKQPVSGAD